MSAQHKKSLTATNNPNAKTQSHENDGVDRQSDGYQPEYAERARGMCTMGAGDLELADEFGVTLSQIRSWQTAHPEFGEACQIGREKIAQRVEEALVKRAFGGKRLVVKPMKTNGRMELVSYWEHVPGDVRVQKFLLTFYRPDLFKKDIVGASIRDAELEKIRKEIRDEVYEESIPKLARAWNNTGKRPKEY